jgi:hypothetical protein
MTSDRSASRRRSNDACLALTGITTDGPERRKRVLLLYRHSCGVLNQEKAIETTKEDLQFKMLCELDSDVSPRNYELTISLRNQSLPQTCYTS